MGLREQRHVRVLHDHAVWAASQPRPNRGRGPAEIDFNALWDYGYVPVIKELGYQPVRADQDTGALIIDQMLERLYFADLVLADMTIPNGNVYYEVGIRHAAQKTGCVLFAADWSKQLFDVMQTRTVPYPLPEGNITEETAGALRPKIKAGSLRSATASRRCINPSQVVRTMSIRPRRRRPRTNSLNSRRSRPKCVRCVSRRRKGACNLHRRWSQTKERRRLSIGAQN